MKRYIILTILRLVFVCASFIDDIIGLLVFWNDKLFNFGLHPSFRMTAISYYAKYRDLGTIRGEK